MKKDIPMITWIRDHWVQPIVNQWPFMVAYIVLVGWESVLQNPVPRWMIIFFQAWLAAAVVELLHWRIVKWLSYAVIYTLFITELVLEWHFGMYLSPTILTLLIETNSQESGEFLSTLFRQPAFGTTLACIVLLMLANIALEMLHVSRLRIQCSWLKIKSIWFKGLAALLLVSGLVFSAISYTELFSCDEMNDVDEWRSHRRNPNDVVTQLIVAVYDTHLSSREMQRAIEQVHHIKVISKSKADNPKPINVIFVIGESYIKEHASLYGYPLQTTPFMDAEQEAGRLFAFADAVSPYNQTTKVIRNLISCNSMGDGEHWASKPPLTAVFKKNGFYVTMYDNQKSTGNQLLTELFDFSLATYLYSSEMAEACYDDINDETYDMDGELIDAYRETIEGDASVSRFLVFHLMGQHVDFAARYPWDTYRRFTADSITFRKEPWLDDEMRKDIAHYDNATLYNDAVIRAITQLYADESTVMLYLSDHGQAEDATQDTWIKAWKHMDDFEKKNIANEKAWLLRIAINTCKDYRRTAWFRHIDRSKALDELPPRLVAAEPEDRTLTLTVMDLPDRYKQVILLYYFQGLTMQETADALDVSQATVHRRLEKAEELLKGSLTGGAAYEG